MRVGKFEKGSPSTIPVDLGGEMESAAGEFGLGDKADEHG